MKFFSNLFLFCFLPALLLAQQLPQAQKLAIKNTNSDSSKFIALYQANLYFEQINTDSANYYIDQALKVATKNNNKLCMANALICKGYNMTVKGNYGNAYRLLQNAFTLLNDPGSASKVWQPCAFIDSVESNEMKKAYSAEMHCLRALSHLNHILGILMGRMENQPKAIYYFKNALKTATSINSKVRIILAEMNLGRAYFRINKLDSALFFGEKALADAKLASTNRFLGVMILSIGDIELKKGNYINAKNYYYTALKQSEKDNNLNGLGMNYMALTKLYLTEHQKDSSLYFAYHALYYFKKNNNIYYDNNLGVAYQNLFKCYQLRHEVDSANKYAGLALAAKDEFNQTRISNISDFQNLSFNDRLKLESLEKEKVINENKTRIIGLGVGLLAVLIIALILYQNNRQKQKANKLLSDKNREIEAQRQEAQIEVALEKVRSCSLAMVKANDLQDVVNIIFEKLSEMNFDQDSIVIIVPNKKSYELQFWIGTKGKLYSRPLILQKNNDPIANELMQAFLSGIDYFSKVYSIEEKNQFYTWAFEYTDFKYMPEERKTIALNCDSYALSIACGKVSMIQSTSFVGKPLSDKQSLMLKRFVHVFDQAYIRFLDLKKAEEQAYEAQIEAALEQVRSCSLAMTSTNDLREVVAIVYDKLKFLGLNMDGSAIVISLFTENTSDIVQWIADSNQAYPWSFKHPYFENPIFLDLISGKNNGLDYFSRIYSFEVKNEFWEYYFANTDFGKLPDGIKREILEKESYAQTIAFAKNSGILYPNINGEILKDDQIKILQRFAYVFDQAYIRFLDLQKAELQAYEAKIEAALEKVRSRSLAMNKTDELQSIVNIVFEKLYEMSFDQDAITIAIASKIDDSFDTWIGAEGRPYGKSILLPSHNDPLSAFVLQTFKDKAEFISKVFSGSELNQFYDWAFEKTDLKYMPPKRKELVRNCESNGFSISCGKLLLIHSISYNGKTLNEKEGEVLKRFVRVFEQAYIRFLDLQKAEIQAHEAKVEAFLERIRTLAIAMRNSNDLAVTIGNAFSELRTLNLKPLRWGVGIITSETQIAKIYSINQSSSKVELSISSDLVLSANPLYQQVYESWLKKDNYFGRSFEGSELLNYYKSLPDINQTEIVSENKHNKIEYGNWFFFTEGFLNIWSYLKYSEAEIAIFERFKKVIELIFKRYIELKHSEELSKKTLEKASIDRVRAEIASMRRTSDLQRITPLIWNELKALGVPFSRCGVFIVDEVNELINTYLATPDGKAIASFDVPFEADGIGKVVLESWRKKSAITLFWNEEEFKQQSRTLLLRGQIASEQDYLTQQPLTSLNLHFFPFLQGMLYVGNLLPLSENAMQLVQSLADAFSTAYARYEDFNKLEIAKKEVESTLIELRSTQTQLIQKEKMASLGELTAGIAHEIQNPLNFVNNFSEVSVELLAEMDEELDKGDINEAKSIRADIKQNLEKINHHGKRADAIVKGMLEHSRAGSGTKEPTDINKLADEYLRLSYHGLRAKDKTFNAEMVTNFDEKLPLINVIAQDIGRVMLNLLNNAFYAVHQKAKTAGADYNPTVVVETFFLPHLGVGGLKVKDNGIGIPEHIKDKIMQPFFTTKPTGEGTGLGLSLTYDMVVKGHRGKIEVESKVGKGAEFMITLPIN